MQRGVAPFAFGVAAASSILASLVAFGTRSSLAADADRFVDIVAAEAVAQGYVKGNDQRFAIVWVIVFLLVFGVGLWWRDVAVRAPRTAGPRPLQAVVWAVGIVAVAVISVTHRDGAMSVVLGTVPLVAAAVRLVRRTDRLEVWAASGSTVAGLAGVATLVSVVSGGAFTLPTHAVGWSVFAAVLGGSALALAEVSEALRARITAIAQIPVPLLVLPLGRSFAVAGGQRMVAPGSSLLLVAVVCVVAGGVVYASVRARTRRDHGLLWTTAVAVYAATAMPEIAPSLPLLFDDFHGGELVVQLPALRQGLGLYRTFIPTPGGVGAVYGVINAVLGDGYATFPRAVALVTAAGAGLSGWLFSRRLPACWTLLLAPVAAFAFRSDRLLFVVPSLLILVSPLVWNRLVVLAWAWPVVLALNVLLVPASGMALLVGSAPVVVLRVWSLARRGEPLRWGVLAALISMGTLVPLAPTLIGAVSTTIAQASTNLLVWGRPLFWASSGNAGGWTLVGRWVWWATSAAGWWLGLPLVLAVVARRGFRGLRRLESSRDGLLLAAAGVLVAFTPYAIGRVDEGLDLTRINSVTIVVAGVLFTAALLMPAEDPDDRLRLSAAASVLLFVPVILMSESEAVPFRGIRATYTVDGNDLVDGEAGGMPSLGQLDVLDRAYAERRHAVRAVIDAVLEPDETYVDFSNNQALYAFFDRPIPRVHAASAFLATSDLQAGAIRRFEDDPPPLAVLSAGTGTLGGVVLDWPGVRSYRMVRWFAEGGYEALEHDGIVIFVRSDRVHRAAAVGYSPADAATVDAAAAPRDLRGIPAAWGASWSSLRARFRGATPSSTPRPDFALVASACPGATVEVRESGAPRSTVSFVAGPLNLVPLGAHPSVLGTGGSPAALTFEVVGGAERCTDHRVSVRGLYRLVR